MSTSPCWQRLPLLTRVALAATLVATGCADGAPAETTASPSATAPVDSTTIAVSPKPTTSTLPEAVSPPHELDDALDLVAGTGCADWNASAQLLGVVDGDLSADMMGVEVSTDGGSVDRFVMTGQLLDSHAGAQAFSSATDEVATVHALLSFNHNRNNQLYAAFLQRRVEMVFEKRDSPVAEGPSGHITWDGSTVSETDSFEIELGVFELFPSPPLDATVSDEAADLAWGQLESWLGDVRVALAAPGVFVENDNWAADIQAIRGLYCVLFATEWQVAAAAIEGNEQDPEWLAENGDVFTTEIALQEILLIIEYLEIVRDYLDRPEVDWFNAEGVDLSQAIDGVTSATEYVELWRYGAADSLGRLDLLLP